MSELHSNRRQRAQQELGLDNAKEQQEMEKSIQREEERRQEKERKRMEIEESNSYQATQAIAKYMDKYFLDPIIGLFIPGIGDILSSVMVLPFIYVSLFKIRSLPLTLAVIANVLRDMAIGLIPFWIGDIADIFHRSYLQNSKLIVGFVEDDREIIQKVNKKASWMFILIVIFCVIIYALFKLAVTVTTSLWSFISGLFS